MTILEAPHDCSDLVSYLLTAPDPAAVLRQRATHLQQDPACAAQLAAALKNQTDHYLRTDLARARQSLALALELADLTGTPTLRALALRAQGNMLMIGEYRCEEAIDCYDQAAAVYEAEGQPAAAAQSQVGKVGCLFFLSRYPEAIAVGEAIRPTLAKHEEWGALTGLLLNLAAIHRRLGEGKAALTLLDEAEAIGRRPGSGSELPGIILNRANVLCDLGRLDPALAAGRQAEALFQERGQPIGVARAQMSQAIALFQLGRYNQALALFDRAQAGYEADGRYTDALLVDRFAAELLLQLGRYTETLERCVQVRTRYRNHAIPYEVAQALRVEAVAHAALGQVKQALATLAEARTLLAGNAVREGMIDLETAVLLNQQNQPAEGLALALACEQVFHAHDHHFPASRARLTAARALWQLGRAPEAETLCRRALDDEQPESSPCLIFEAYHLLGQMAQADGGITAAIHAYDQAIAQLDLLRGRLMVELRADFLSNKEQVYEDIVTAYLTVGQPQAALLRVTQAKSRALLDLLTHRLELRLTPRHDRDRPLVDRLAHLRERRNQLLRRAETTQDEEDQDDDRRLLWQLEKEIAAGWQKLLVQNADYASDREAVHLHTIMDQPPLETGTLLLEFFIAHGELIVFLISEEGVEVRRLPGALSQLDRPARLLNVNLKAVPLRPPEESTALIAGAQTQLARLYQILLQPLAGDLARYSRLAFAPHGALLHYLPFGALYDGEQYLAERYQIVSLPTAGLRRHPSPQATPSGKAAVFGYSANGRLPA